MFKFLYIAFTVIALFTDPALGFVLLFFGYVMLIVDGLKDNPTRMKTYKERFHEVSQKKTYIVDDYENDTTTKKVLQ